MSSSSDVISVDGLRHDSRMANEARGMRLEFDAVPGASGSVMLTSGGTVVIAAVYGPSPLNHLTPLATAGTRDTVLLTCRSCSIGRPRGAPVHAAGRELAQFIVSSLFPAIIPGALERCEIALTIDIPSVDSDVRAVAITACGAALANASVPLTGLPVGAAVCLAGEVPIVDVDATEAQQLRISLAPDGRGCGIVPHVIATYHGGQDAAAAAAAGISLIGGRCSPLQLRAMLEVAASVAVSWEGTVSDALKASVLESSKYANLYT